MKNVRIRAWLLCALFLCSMVLLCACKAEDGSKGEGTSNPTSNVSGDATYKVSIVDGAGNPYTEKIIVRFLKNGKQAAMVRVDDKGVAQKALPKGEYTVEISTTGDDATRHYEPLTLTAEKTEGKVVLAFGPKGEPQEIYADSIATGENQAYDAYDVAVGSTYVSLKAGDRNYFLFTPTQAGTYEITVTGGEATLGYYGMPHYVQTNNVGDVVDGVLTLTVYPDMISTENTGTSVYVIGVEPAAGTDAAVLNVLRVGEPAWSITSEPWFVYQPKTDIKPFTLPEGTVLRDMDLTASTDTYNLVLGTDGYYHIGSAEGPVVYVHMQKLMYGISLLTMIGDIVYDENGDLVPTGTVPFRYQYDNGPDDFFKEEYTSVMREFIHNRDAKTGVYPMTEDLFYILPKGVEAMGWCREGTVNYLFTDLIGVNNEISWLFLCCYAA